jgi:hypothetical protein
MELREWQSMNKPTGSTTSNTTSGSVQATSSTFYRDKFKKLLDYHVSKSRKPGGFYRVLNHKVDKLTEDTTKASFSYWEERMDNSDGTVSEVSLSVWYYKTTKAWTFKVWVDGREVANKSGSGFNDLINDLSARLATPLRGTKEWQELLEWQLMNPPKASQPAPTASSKTNKEKFTELVAYMQKHKDSSVIFTSVNGPTDTGFEYEEQKAFANGDEYNLSLEVECKSGNLFFIHLDMDGKRIATKSAVGWEDLLLKIKTHFYVPKMGSHEYKSLTESVSIADDFKLYENLWN